MAEVRCSVDILVAPRRSDTDVRRMAACARIEGVDLRAARGEALRRALGWATGVGAIDDRIAEIVRTQKK